MLSRHELALENLVLCQQLAVVGRKNFIDTNRVGIFANFPVNSLLIVERILGGS